MDFELETSHKVMLALLAVGGWLWWSGRGVSQLPPGTVATLDGRTMDLSTCATARCVTVVVAPWCGACHEAQSSIKACRDAFNARGVHTRIVVTDDKPSALRADAETWGPFTGVDLGNTLHPRGVPHVYITAPGGKVLKDVAGWPMTDDTNLVAKIFEVQ